MVRLVPIAAVSALLAMPVLGFEGSKHSAAAEELSPSVETGRTGPSAGREAAREDGASPSCERKVRVVYSGIGTQPDPCRIAR